METKHWAYIGIGLTCLYFFATCDGCGNSNEEEVYESEYQADNQQSSCVFSNEQNVRTYLCSRRFLSNDGARLTFSSNANSVFINGTQLSSSIDISIQSYDCALIRTHGPYGNTTLTVSVSGSDGVIVDGNSGDTYYAQ